MSREAALVSYETSITPGSVDSSRYLTERYRLSRPMFLFLDDEIRSPFSLEVRQRWGGERASVVERTFARPRSRTMEIQNRRRVGFRRTFGESGKGRIDVCAHIFRIGQRQEIKRGGLKGDVRTSNFGQGTFLGIVPGFISSRSVELLSEEEPRPRNILLPAVTSMYKRSPSRER